MATETQHRPDVPTDEQRRSLAQAVRGDVLTADHERYDDARAVWNGMIDRYPAVIVQCTGTADVVAALDFARETELPVAVRSGGHNVAGRAVVDDGLVIDLTPMSGVAVDRTHRTVSVGGGATLGDVDHETQLFGLATPLGAVSETGVAGLTLNGGYGHLTREYGLAADNLRSVEVVTVDGEVHTASAVRNPDLFWAVRGGGGTVGVVTRFEFDCHEVGPEVATLFVWFHGDDTAAVFERFREWATDAPRSAGVLPFTAHVPEVHEFPEAYWGEPAVALLGSARGDAEAGPAEAVFEPLLDAATPIADFSGPMAYEDLQSMLDEDYPDGLRYYWKSVYLTDLTDAVIDLLAEYTETAPSPLSTIDVWQLGGAVADVPRDATAFCHRDKPFMCNFEANWEDAADDDANVTWAREGFAAVAALEEAAGRYGNFPGFDEDPARLTYGENYDRLARLNATYDPENRLGGPVSPV
ncbi:FAD-binding oxidoreductase [Halorientalis pallida]|uniref:FAD-binding oxidoreductase n=1 Tax=Halorientalis pallida TaxID=2479928 RepID=A0A498L427_9EURY|nr:FAD-binding oxidoreductase [Halorientalis pallida]RXK50564.1 FAD-binding oxidoreductase [Halorientalis pallida]